MHTAALEKEDLCLSRVHKSRPLRTWICVRLLLWDPSASNRILPHCEPRLLQRTHGHTCMAHKRCSRNVVYIYVLYQTMSCLPVMLRKLTQNDIVFFAPLPALPIVFPPPPPSLPPPDSEDTSKWCEGLLALRIRGTGDPSDPFSP